MMRVNKWIVQSDFSAALQRRKRPAQEGSFFVEAGSSSAAASSDPPQAELAYNFDDYLE